jgi:hypothetical protein
MTAGASNIWPIAAHGSGNWYLLPLVVLGFQTTWQNHMICISPKATRGVTTQLVKAVQMITIFCILLGNVPGIVIHISKYQRLIE